MEKRGICTIVSKNYLPLARTLMQSVKKYHPEVARYVLLVDEVNGFFDPQSEDFEIFLSSELDIPKNKLFHFKYNILELNTAVKPYFLQFLFQKYGLVKLLYIDPDIMLFDTLDPIWSALENSSIALTPHLLEILDDKRKPDEWEIMRSGTYNLGFIGLSQSEQTRSFLKWWQKKLYNDCISDPAKNLFTDQRWIDLVPGMFDNVFILRDPGLNVAYWNLLNRFISKDKGRFKANGEPLRFFHFSGFKAENKEAVSRYQDRYVMGNVGSSRELFEIYRQQLFENGYLECKDWPYAYGLFSNGEKIPDFVRRLIRDDLDFQAELDEAYTPESDSRIIRYLNEPFDASSKEKLLISRLLWGVYKARPDVQEAFPDISNHNRFEIVKWFLSTGAIEFKLNKWFTDPISYSLSKYGKDKEVKEALSQFGLSWDIDYANCSFDDDQDHEKVLVTNFAHRVYLSRPDVQSLYPQVAGKDRIGVARWFVDHASIEYSLNSTLVKPMALFLETLDREIAGFENFPQLARVDNLEPPEAGISAEQYPSSLGCNQSLGQRAFYNIASNKLVNNSSAGVREAFEEVILTNKNGSSKKGNGAQNFEEKSKDTLEVWSSEIKMDQPDLKYTTFPEPEEKGVKDANIGLMDLNEPNPTIIKTPDLGTVELEELTGLFQVWLKGFPPEVPVVVLPVYNGYQELMEAVFNLQLTLTQSTPLLIIDDNSSDLRVAGLIKDLCSDNPARIFSVLKPSQSGLSDCLNTAFELCAHRDVAVVQCNVTLPHGWLERMTTSAYSRSSVATVSAFTNHGSFLSLPYRNKPVWSMPKGLSLEETDRLIKDSSKKLYPLIPTVLTGCAFFKRIALDVVGNFDLNFTNQEFAEIDFAQRAVSLGFSNILDDDLFVFTKKPQGVDSKLPVATENNKTSWSNYESQSELLESRYPYYNDHLIRVKSDSRSPLARSIQLARSALLGYQIAIDATSINGTPNGTEVVVLELIRALAALPDRRTHLSVIIENGVPHQALRGVEVMVDEIIRISELEEIEQPSFDLIHRPVQVGAVEYLSFLHKASSRFIITQLDLIAYSNPGYFKNKEWWRTYQEVTRASFAFADGVAYLSNEVAQDAKHQGLAELISEERTLVTHLGVDHQLFRSEESVPPQSASKFQDYPFLLMLGANFKHKNRVFALKLFKDLIESHNWSGHFVIAGPSTSTGGSQAEEMALLEQNKKVGSRVHYLGAVNEAEKRWLLEKASLVLYPSIYEGFGMVPFEAAASGTPALSSSLTSLKEVLGDNLIYLENFDPKQGAKLAYSLLSNPKAAQTQVEAINDRSSAFKWDDVAANTWEFYNKILKLPPRFQESQKELFTASRKLEADVNLSEEKELGKKLQLKLDSSREELIILTAKLYASVTSNEALKAQLIDAEDALEKLQTNYREKTRAMEKSISEINHLHTKNEALLIEKNEQILNKDALIQGLSNGKVMKLLLLFQTLANSLKGKS